MTKRELKKYMKKLVDLFDDEPDTWIKGAFSAYRENGVRHGATKKTPANCWCLAGGIRSITDDEESFVLRGPIMDHIAAALPRSREGSELAIVTWNDRKTRTFKDVKELLKERYKAV